jgi:phosphate:Na+ symporter
MEPSGTYLLLLIFGAAALLLWGTRMVRTGVTRGFGTEMRRILARGLANRLLAAGSGALAAGSLQSSTAVALLVTSFAKAGFLGVALGLALMLGADVGSAIIASLLTLDIKRFWPLFIFVGYVLHTAYDLRSSRGKQTGRILLGIGLILLALESMSALSAELSDSPVILMVMRALADEPLVAVLIVAVLTWLAHSSIAMLLFVAALAAAGVLAEPVLVVAMVLGVNIGGAMPAIMLTLAEPAEARRIAIGNGLFKVAGAAAGLVLLPWLAWVYDALPGDPGFRTVIAHILFNVCLAAAFLPLIHPVERLLARLLPGLPEEEEERFGPIYLSSTPSNTLPSLALTSLVRETLRMIDLVEAMLRAAMETLHSAERSRLAEIGRLDDQVDTLCEAIKAYATELTRQDLEPAESRRAIDILSYATSLENAGDVVDKSLIDIVDKKIRSRTAFSDQGEAELKRLFAYVMETSRLAAAVTMNWDPNEAEALLERKRAYKRMVGESSQRHLERLRQGDPQSLKTSSFHLDIIGDFQRVNSLLTGIAYSVLGHHADDHQNDSPEGDGDSQTSQ